MWIVDDVEVPVGYLGFGLVLRMKFRSRDRVMSMAAKHLAKIEGYVFAPYVRENERNYGILWTVRIDDTVSFVYFVEPAVH